MLTKGEFIKRFVKSEARRDLTDEARHEQAKRIYSMWMRPAHPTGHAAAQLLR